MKLKLLVATLTVLLTTSGCVVHFPLADNSPSLQSFSDSQFSHSTSSTAGMGLAPTEANNNDPVKGNTADSPY